MIEENGAEFLLALGRAGGGEERTERFGQTADAGRIQWTIGGSPIAYHNAVIRAELSPAHVDEAVALSIDRMQAHGVAGSWHVGPSMTPPDLRERLQVHGFTGWEDDTSEPGMAADLDRLPADVPHIAGLEIEQVADERHLEQFRQVLAAGFGEGPREADWVCEMYARIGLGARTPWRHYVGRVGDVPVSTTSVYFAAGAAGIYFVCTLPPYRRQGIGAATTLAALQQAHREGYRHGVLTSSPMGYRVYQELGFREHCRIGVPEYDPATIKP